MSRMLLSMALVVGIAGTAVGQQASSCAREMSIDSLRATALQLYRDVVTMPRAEFGVVVLVLDDQCKLLHHGFGHRWGSVSVGTLRRFVPAAAEYTFSVVGYADLLGVQARDLPDARTRAPWDEGRPWVAWAIRETAPGR